MLRKDYTQLLFPRRYLLEGDKVDDNALYYAAYLANIFAVLVDNPSKLCSENVADVEAQFGSEVPKSFYENPQDTKYYSCGELLLEQMVSYLMILGREESENAEIFKNPEIVQKILPAYARGNEYVDRKYHIVTREEADKILAEIMKNYCEYTRPWSEDEVEEIKILLRGDYYNGELVKCRDNIAKLFYESGEIRFAEQLDRKDVVKLSVSMFGDSDPLVLNAKNTALLKIAAVAAKPCPMTKKQAKYFNKIIKFTDADLKKTDNSESPYAVVKKIIAKGDVVGAAKYLKENGSMLTRNIAWLMSRVSENEVDDILKILDGGNPVANLQLLFMLVSQRSGGRVFKFISNGRVRVHVETPEEIEKRRSRISDSVREKIVDIILKNIKKYYRSRPSLGKIYVSEGFRKVFVPLNTSASGKGIDVLPTGSRIPIKGDFLRVFCYWHGLYDIDLSVVFEDGNGERQKLNWETFSLKPFGDSALLSGDDRSADGAEYADFAIDEIRDLDWKYAVLLINGFNDKLDKGTIYCGYQDKDDLNTQVWMPDNIAMQMHVKGKCRQFTAFALDIEKREIVVLNLLGGQDNDIASCSDINAVGSYLDSRSLDTFSMYDLLKLRGETVSDPEKADIVFDDEYEAKEGQTVVRPWDVEKLVSLTV